MSGSKTGNAFSVLLLCLQCNNLLAINSLSADATVVDAAKLLVLAACHALRRAAIESDSAVYLGSFIIGFGLTTCFGGDAIIIQACLNL